MFTFVTLLVLGLLLGIVLMQLFKKPTPPAAPVADLANLKVTDARAGDALSISVRVGGDEEVEVSLHADLRKLTIEDLGLAEEDLSEMDERQNTADSFEFDGKVWMYRLSREVQSTRDDQAVAAGFYYWEFQEQNGKGLIAVRKAEGEPFGVTMYAGINAADVTVYRG